MSVRLGLMWLFSAVLLLEGAVAVLPHVHHAEGLVTSCAPQDHDHDHGTAWAAVLKVERHRDCLACTSLLIPGSAVPHEIRIYASPRPVAVLAESHDTQRDGSRLSDTSPRGPPGIV